jgi:hypothetical protein
VAEPAADQRSHGDHDHPGPDEVLVEPAEARLADDPVDDRQPDGVGDPYQ